jgi:hypothetical protein
MSDDKDDPVAPLRILGERVVEAMTVLGLSVENFAVLPNFGGGPHMAQVVVSFDADAISALVGKDEEQSAIDEQFKEFMREEKKAEEAQKLTDAEASLRKLAEELGGADGGILGDDNG